MRNLKPSIWHSKRFCITFFTFKGISIIILMLLFFAFIMTVFDVSPLIIRMMSTLALGFGGFISAFGYAKKRRRYGLITGFICGIVLCIIYILIAIIFFRQANFFTVIAKIAVIAVSACIGGVTGVNTNFRKPPD